MKSLYVSFALSALLIFAAHNDADDLDDYQPQHRSRENAKKSYIRRSILRRLLDYAQDGTNPVTGEKAEDSQYYEELYKICGNNATCINDIISRAVKAQNGDASDKEQWKYDRLVLQIVSDVKEWLKEHEIDEKPMKKASKGRKKKKVHFEEDKTESHHAEKHNRSAKRKHAHSQHSQGKLWFTGLLFVLFGFMLRRALRVPPGMGFEGKVSILDNSRAVIFLRKYLFV